MSFRKTNPKIAIIVNGREDRLGTKITGNKTKASTTSSTSTASTKTTCASTVTSTIAETSTRAKSTSTSATKAAARPSVAEIKAASKQDEFDDELESMLSLTQTLSFWDGDGDTFANSYDNTSYSGNTYDSSSTLDDRRGVGDRYNNQVASCGGEGLEDALETFVITGRAISSALKSSSKSMNSLFWGKLKQDVEKKEKMKKLEEEKSMKREAQLREEMLTARYEISNIADLWREK